MSRAVSRLRLTGFFVAVALFVAFGVALAQERGGTLTIGLGYEIDTLNPYSTGYLGDVQATVLEGLIAPDSNAEYVPVLATEVPTLENGGIVLSEDGETMTVTYTLRDGVTWSDGEPFTSADVAFTWEAVKNPDFLAESKDGTDDIVSIETPDPLTVVVNYNTVAPDFASTLFTFGILPQHVLEGQDLNTSEFNQKPIGTGPFMVSEYQAGQYVVLERNPNYWDTAEDGTQLPYLDGLVFRIVPDSNTLVTQLKSGELDMAYGVPYSQIAGFEEQAGVRVIANKTLSWQHLDFNLANPILNDLAVRQAFAHAIDKNTVSRALGGYPEVIDTVVVPLFPFSNPDVPTYGYDVEEANRLLDEAGYTLGDDGVRVDSAGNRLSFRILTQSGRTEYETAQQVMVANLKAVGIELVPDNKSGVAYTDARYDGDYDLFYAGWITPADPNYAIFYETGGVLNSQGYSNPELDAVLENANTTIEPEARADYLRQFQEILMTDIPTLPIVSGPSMIVVTERLQNFEPNPTNMTNFVHTSNWYLNQ